MEHHQHRYSARGQEGAVGTVAQCAVLAQGTTRHSAQADYDLLGMQTECCQDFQVFKKS